VDDISVVPLDPIPLPDTSTVKEFREEQILMNRDYILKNIQFEFDSYVLLRSSHVELDKVVNFLKSNTTVTVRLLGHTDFLGTDEYNIKLSQDRSRSVADYLISKGIEPQRINTYGFGKSRPLLLEKTDEARSINRRVEIRFIN
jgi:outer membrane protein OmpA-like peptidoglycan-associated protein